MRQRILALSVTILGLLFASLASTQEKVVVSHTTRGSLSIGPLLYGIERGFYRDEGIDLVYVSIRADLGIKALLSGDVDYLYSVGTIIRGAALGIPVKKSRGQFRRRHRRSRGQGCTPTIGIGSDERRDHRHFGSGHLALCRATIRDRPCHSHAHPLEYSNEERRL